MSVSIPSRLDVLVEALNHVGYHETGNNRTTFAAELDEAFGTGYRDGSAWCATHNLYCYWVAAGRPPENPLPIESFTVFADMDAWREADRWVGRGRSVYAKPGDMVIFGGHNFLEGHTGLLIGFRPDGLVTIEGNDGNEVRLHDGTEHPLRSILDVLGFGQPEYADVDIVKRADDPACYLRTDGVIGDYVPAEHPYARLIELGYPVPVV